MGKVGKYFLKSGKPHHFHMYSVYGLICSIVETKRGPKYPEKHPRLLHYPDYISVSLSTILSQI